jgi:hypothetical protein
MEDYFGLAILGLYGLSTLLTTALLVWRVVRPAVPLRAVEIVFYVMSLVVLPTGALVLAMLGFTPEWKGEVRHGWFGLFDVAPAGCWVLPLWLTAGVFLLWGLAGGRRESRLFTSKAVFVAIAVMAVISFWYTGMYPIYSRLHLATDGKSGWSVFRPHNIMRAVVWPAIPGVLCLNQVLLMVGIRRRGQLSGPFRLPILAWLAAMIATAILKWRSAIDAYAARGTPRRAADGLLRRHRRRPGARGAGRQSRRPAHGAARQPPTPHDADRRGPTDGTSCIDPSRPPPNLQRRRSGRGAETPVAPGRRRGLRHPEADRASGGLLRPLHQREERGLTMKVKLINSHWEGASE